MDLNKIKCSQDVYQFMDDNIEYSWIDINGNKHLNTIVDYYIKLRCGKDSPTKEFYEIPVCISFKEFNKYINHV